MDTPHGSMFSCVLAQIPKLDSSSSFVLDATAFLRRKEPDCSAIILFRYLIVKHPDFRGRGGGVLNLGV